MRIPLHVTAPLKAALELAAFQNETSISDYCRKAVRAQLRRDGVTVEQRNG
jgi:hypothetical protein